ncbi:MAG TPA: VTT domain-containing protein [Xanthomonadaceae bacterium]|nr:VTT domain-containing protein [Xanthomonadaceae bacterium]
MDSSTLDGLITWIGQHPVAAGAVVFAIAFCDAIVVLGIAVPALPLLFAVGALVGLGHIDGTYAIASATAGAFLGDGLSYLFGRHYGAQLKGMWPFSRHPEWLAGGEQFFRRHGTKGIVIARYVGAVRPFVPAIAGMLRMRGREYVPPSLFAAATWAIAGIVPGWLFGESMELLAAIAGRLAIVVGLLVVLVIAIYLGTVTLYRFFAPRAASLLERALAWSHRHPVLGRYSEALIDPNRPESASLALLAMLLLLAGWALFSLLVVLGGKGEPLALDLAVHQLMFALRTPLVDRPLAMLAGLGDWEVLAPAALVVSAWLLWRRRHIAAWHWVAAIAFGLALTFMLGILLDVPKPPAATAAPGFSFPSGPVTMATVVYGFFAVLIARELPGRRRAWPYAAAGMLVALIAFARLYLGAHWASDILGGALLGMVWIAGLGIAYRRRVLRSFWVRPISALFFITVSIAGLWHGTRSAERTLIRFDPPQVTRQITRAQWWQQAWIELPSHRNDVTHASAWPLNLQYAGPLRGLARTLEDRGWRGVRAGGWRGLLYSLDAEASPDTLPILPASHHGGGEALLMSRPGPDPDTRYVVRLWRSPLRVDAGRTPVWQGTVAQMRFERRFGLFSLWRMDGPHEQARQALAHALSPWPERLALRTAQGEAPVLLVAWPVLEAPATR